jgi:hypothetical protein
MVSYINSEDLKKIYEIGTSSNESGAIFHDSISNHLQMLEECRNFSGWVRMDGQEETTDDLIREHRDRMVRIDNTRYNSPDKPWDRWLAIPTQEHFPTLYDFLQKNTHQYKNCSVSRLGPGAKINPHIHHVLKPKYLYNLCINFPEGCKFEVHPNGEIPYRPGDIYRLQTRHLHSVTNDSNVDRYHVVMEHL